MPIFSLRFSASASPALPCYRAPPPPGGSHSALSFWPRACVQAASYLSPCRCVRRRGAAFPLPRLSRVRAQKGSSQKKRRFGLFNRFISAAETATPTEIRRDREIRYDRYFLELFSPRRRPPFRLESILTLNRVREIRVAFFLLESYVVITACDEIRGRKNFHDATFILIKFHLLSLLSN